MTPRNSVGRFAISQSQAGLSCCSRWPSSLTRPWREAKAYFFFVVLPAAFFGEGEAFFAGAAFFSATFFAGAAFFVAMTINSIGWALSLRRFGFPERPGLGNLASTSQATHLLVSLGDSCILARVAIQSDGSDKRSMVDRVLLILPESHRRSQSNSLRQTGYSVQVAELNQLCHPFVKASSQT